MKTRVTNSTNSMLKLVVDQPGIPVKEMASLVRATLYEGTGCWSIEDVRLAKFSTPHKWFCMGADRYQASFVTENESESAVVRSMLRDFRETPVQGLQENGTEFTWCTYDGLVAGRTAADLGGNGVWSGNLAGGAPLFHKLSEVRAYLADAAQFWDAFPCDETAPDILYRAGKVKLENTNFQPTESQVLGTIIIFRQGIMTPESETASSLIAKLKAM